MWNGTIQIKKDTIKDVTKVCEDIAKRDETFEWKVDDGKLLITHENKDKVWKRVVWLTNKVKALEGCKFMVKRSKV